MPANFTWTFDAPSGTYKNHALSRELLYSALEQTVVSPFARAVEGFGRRMGESVTLMRVAALDDPSDATFLETERIPEDEFSLSTKQITVEQLGRAVPFSDFADLLSFFELENPIQRRLRDQMGKVLDRKAADAFKQAQVKYVPTGAATNTITTNGSFGDTATNNMNFFHVEEIRDYLFDTLHAPPLEGGDYVGIFRTKSIRGIKRDDDWEEWYKYTTPSQKQSGEVGRIEGIRFIETNHANAFDNVGTSDVLGEGVVFGEDNIALAEALTPELRVAMPENFGLSRAVAWYTVLKYDIIWDTGNPGEARIIHVGSDS